MNPFNDFLNDVNTVCRVFKAGSDLIDALNPEN